MTSIRNARLLQISGLLLSVLVWLANSANPTNGRTGAPFDGHCNSCHDGNNPNGYNGTVEITGMPAVVQPGTVYPLTITLTATAGTPVKGGFQLVSVDDSNVNAGTLAAVNTQCGVESSNGRRYVEHRGAKNFSGGAVSWTFNWTSPAVASGGHINFWYIGNFTNGTGGDSGDRPLAFSSTYDFSGPSEPVTATITSFSNPTCNGANNGSITVTAEGGLSPYTYAWNNGQTGATANNLAAGTYTVTVTGASGSGTATAVKQLTQPIAMTLTTNATGTITCAQTTVNVSATAQGGTSPYSFQWSNGTSGQQTTYTQGGTYTVTVTDNGGCTRTATGTIATNTAPPTAAIALPGTLTCQTTSLVLDANASSSGANITYAWSAANGGNIVTGATTRTPTINSCGLYILTVTNNVNGCTASASRTVACNTTPPGVTVQGGTITCATPSVTLLASSLTNNVSYAWTGPCIQSGTNAFNATVGCNGTYTVTVTNPANSCTSSASTLVGIDTVAPVVTIGSVPPLTCLTSSVQIPLSTSPAGIYTYNWTGPCITPATQQSPSPVVCTPGSYSVVVTRPGNGCTSSATVIVESNVSAPVASIAIPARLNCNTSIVELDGSNSSQGTNFTYQWTTTNGNIVSGSSQDNAFADEPGTYRLVVTNVVNGCSSEAFVLIQESAPVAAVATGGAASCAGGANGTAGVIASGGSGSFTYAWSNGGTLAQISGLAAGTYTVTVTDGAGCSATATATVTQPTALEVAIATTPQSALNINDGTASATVTGGTPGYNYFWSNNATTASMSNLAPGTYTLLVTDANGCTVTGIGNVNSFNCNISGSIETTDVSCNGGSDGSATVQLTGATQPVTYQWSNSASSATAGNLSAGSYTVSLTDGAGCPLVFTAQIGQPTAVTAIMSATNETIPASGNGTATVQANGGTPGYTYLWNTNDTTASIQNLAPGTYTVTVQDANGCSAVGSVVVAALSCDVQTEIVVSPVKCFDTPSGTATVIVTNATGDIDYAWNTGADTETAENLTEGTFTVTVTDAAGCTAVATAEIDGPDAPLVTEVVNIQHVLCPSDANGSATPIISGGWGPPYSFQFSWGLGGFDNLAAGDYSFTVTDGEGCSSVAGFEILVSDTTGPTLQCPDNFVLCGADLVNYDTPDVTDNCSGATTIALISGQASGSAFLDGVTTQVFLATDAAGNTSTCSFDVIVYPVPDVVIVSIVDDFDGSSAGTIDIDPVGDTGPYTFEWKKDGAFFADTEDLDGLSTGFYTLVMTDVNGCTVQLAPIFIDNIVGTDNPVAAAAGIRLWPNPTHDAFRLEMTNIDPIHMEILNPQGQLVRMLEPSEWNTEISVNSLPAGFYYLKVVSRRGQALVVKWGKAD